MMEQSTSQIEQLKLRVLKILLIVGTSAWAIFGIIESAYGVISSFDLYAYPVLFVYYFLITIFLHLQPQYRAQVSVATIAALALYMVVTHWIYYISPTSAEMQTLSFHHARVVQWYVLIFISAFIFFETKNAIITSVIFYLALALPEVMFLLDNSVQRADEITATTLISLISNPVYIVCLWGVTLLKAHAYRAEGQAIVMKKAALQDSLTGILNRRGATTFINDLQQHSQQTHANCGLVLFDIDHFKMINDSKGHDVGDETLIKIVQLCQTQLRAEDSLVRWGGEEFLVIVPNVTIEAVNKLAERIRLALADKTDGVLANVTASFGVALLTPNSSFQQAMKTADNALYVAKSSGRNQVAMANNF